MRAGGQLLDPGPARAHAVPDPAERPGRREVPVPDPLRVEEGPGIAFGLPEIERVRGEHDERDGERGERAQAIALLPGEQREGRQQRESGRPCQEREPSDDAGFEVAPALGQGEGGQRQQQVERLAVNGLQEEREREDGEVEHGTARPLGA